MSAVPISALASPASVLAMPNGAARPLATVPHLDLGEFQRLVIGARARGRRVSALFGSPREDRIALFAVLAADDEGLVELARTEVDSAGFPSMTPACPEVHLFEREIAEQWAVPPLGHPWLKPVRFQPARRPHSAGSPTIGVTDYYAIGGGDVHEVAVGPVQQA